MMQCKESISCKIRMEIELIRQSLIVVENEKESAHTSEEELGVQSPFPYAEDSDENTYLLNKSQYDYTLSLQMVRCII